MASTMLDEMPVAALTLNELSRRVGVSPELLRPVERRSYLDGEADSGSTMRACASKIMRR